MDLDTRQETLHWRDLSADDVYHIAHLENEERDMFDAQLAKIAFGGKYLQSPEAIRAEHIAKDHEAHAQSWLNSLAEHRNMQPQILTSGETSYPIRGESAEVLYWRDLSADDVYHIAHIENEARYIFSVQISQAAIRSASLQSPDAINAENIIINHEKHAQNWLNDQAAIRGVEPEVLLSGRSGDRITTFHDDRVNDEWLRGQITDHSELNWAKVARAVGVSQGYLSAIKRGRQQASIDVSQRLINFFADAKKLEGEEREAFIKSATLEQNQQAKTAL